MNNFKNTLIQVTKNGMGSGDNDLSLLLVKNYMTLLSEESELPKVIAFYNEGVKLICSGSPVLEILKTLEQKGVKMVACKTCLSHYKLMDDLKVGIIGTMMDFIVLQKAANKVVNL